MMMMVSDDCLVDCQIDDDEEEEIIEVPPPPEFASTPPTPSPVSSSPTPPVSSPSTPPITSPLKNRDPHGINQHLQVDFSGVLAEPAEVHSADRVWLWSVLSWELVRLWSYRCLSLLCGLPLALLAGCLLALLACLHIWCVAPCVQVCQSCLPCVRWVWTCVVDIFISPFCSSLSRCSDHISISLAKEY
ncbi:caveolin-2 [Osmerus eperlanus]|uniref:caveolin-2 n=1 Tax=Osmerus eperlanus TaxID=29151 RepID=UPI002E0FCB5D